MRGIGRKGALASSTALTGVFLFLSTIAKDSKQLLGWNCAYSFTSNVMYGVLYGQTPETFPTMHRGTGNALVGVTNRIMGVLAPVIAMEVDLKKNSETVVYIAASLFILAGVMALLLPFETRGRTAM